jgi:hypothetical protein
MPTEVFQLKTLTRVLAEDVELSEALGIAEVLRRRALRSRFFTLPSGSR